ncbi:MAG: hypothetical protein KF902_02745 [Phycisphaeraceae bacterium]|nr:hypothetical protein [Phycisphaeraceae bacterium]
MKAPGSSKPEARAKRESAKAPPASQPAPPKWSLRDTAKAVTGRLVDSLVDAAADAMQGSEAPSIDDLDLTDVVMAVRQTFTDPDNADLERDQAVRRVARTLGFARVGSRVADLVESGLTAAARRKVILTERGLLSLQTRSIDDYTRDECVEFLIAAMRDAGGPAVWDREEAITAAARYLGFRRTGSTIRDAFRSAINAGIRRGLLERDGGGIRRT